MMIMPYRIFGLRLFSRHSDGALGLASYHPRSSTTWHWSLVLTKNHFGGMWRSPVRRGQWHDYYPLLFGYALRVSRQDYHREKSA